MGGVVHEELRKLDRLDRIDRERWRLESNAHQLRSALAAAQAARAAAEAGLTERKATLDRNRAEERTAQRRLDDLRNSRAAALRVLETGVGDPESAQRQLDRCDALIDEGETAMLEVLEAQDGATAAVRAAEAALAEARATEERLAAEVPGQVGGLEQQVAALTADRTAGLAELPHDLRSRYENWVGRGKWAVARIRDGACDACRMAVQPQHQEDLRKGRMEPCRGCHRWLLPPD